MIKMPIRVLAAPVLVSLALVSCSSPPGQGGQGGPAAPGARGGARGAGGPVPVVTARVERKAMPVTLPAVGTVEAIRRAC